MSRIIVITLGRILNAVGSLVAIRLYTELLMPEQVGKLAILLSSTSIFGLILISPVSSYVTRKAIEWHANHTLIQQLKRPLLYAFISSALATVVSIGLIRVGLLATSLLVAPLVGFAVLGVSLSSFGSQLFNYLGRPFKYVILSVSISWGGVALAGALCYKISATAEAWMIGNITAQVVVGVVSIIVIKRTLGPPAGASLPTPDIGAKGFDPWAIAMYSAPMLLATCLSWIQTDAYRYFFIHMVDERTLGLFAAGLAVGISPMLLLQQLLNDTYTPILTRAVALNGRDKWPRSWDAYASACILPLVLFTSLACSGTPLFAKLLVSHTYYAVAWLGVFGALAKCLQILSSLYVGFSYAALETAHLIGPYFIGAVVTILCIFLLAPLTPFIRFGVSLVCGAAASLVAIAWAAWIRYHLRVPFWAVVRAVGLGLPIVGLNLAARFLIPVHTAIGTVVVLAIDTFYMAGLCWVFHPKDAIADSPQPATPALVSEHASLT